jgi:hypothetical protein
MGLDYGLIISRLLVGLLVSRGQSRAASGLPLTFTSHRLIVKDERDIAVRLRTTAM